MTEDSDLFYNNESIWENLNNHSRKTAFEISEKYIQFINFAKTERLAVKYAIRYAEENGFRKNTEFKEFKTGDRVYFLNRNKNIILVVIGKKRIDDRSHMIAAHIDSPRIDLKANPVYEDTNLVLLKTHYYGGIKKYHWVNIPLNMYGVIIKKDGTVVEVNIGEDENDPVFVISDILPHIGGKTQSKRKFNEIIKGEELNVIAGALPAETAHREKYKLNFLRLLNQKYDIVEEDFLSAELSLVPNMHARFIGLDRGLVGGYGQDDRICSYLSLEAIINTKDPEITGICYLADKEETGSEGNTGAQSQWFVYVINEILEKMNDGNIKNSNLYNTFTNMRVLSSDVNAAVNPSFKQVHELRNAGILGNGPILTKFSGGGGKGGTNDAHAEYIAYLRSVFDRGNINFQLGEWGKVDEGGAGTIAKFLAKYNSEVIDMGPGLIGMHSTYEISHVADIYMTLKAYITFLNSIE